MSQEPTGEAGRSSQAQGAGAPGAGGQDPGPRALRVLVVDDEPNLRKLCQRIIERLGHSCEIAATAAEAAALARTIAFDLCLCDFRLAAETAADVVAALLEAAPALVPRTIIATGAANDPDVVAIRERYQLRLVAKPYGVEELVAMLSSEY